VILKQRANLASPSTHCLPAGIPAGIFIYNFKIIQALQEIVIVLGDGDPPRQIFSDGRSLPRDPQPSWMGYSVGKWQGDTSHPRSEFMRIREAYHRRDFGHLDLEVTPRRPEILHAAVHSKHSIESDPGQ